MATNSNERTPRITNTELLSSSARSRVMGEHERTFQAHLQQEGALAPQQRIEAFAQALWEAVEGLVDDPDIHDDYRMFIRFHAPCCHNSFTQGLRVRLWRQKPHSVTAFLDTLTQRWNSGEQYIPNEPFVGPRDSGHPNTWQDTTTMSDRSGTPTDKTNSGSNKPPMLF